MASSSGGSTSSRHRHQYRLLANVTGQRSLGASCIRRIRVVAAGRPASFASGCLTMLIAIIISCHEVSHRDALNGRNYVAIALCLAWCITSLLLLGGVSKGEKFLVVPWMVLTTVLVVLLIMAIASGAHAIKVCSERSTQGSSSACTHEYHLFGSNDFATVFTKWLFLLLSTAICVIGLTVVCTYYHAAFNSHDVNNCDDASIIKVNSILMEGGCMSDEEADENCTYSATPLSAMVDQEDKRLFYHLQRK